MKHTLNNYRLVGFVMLGALVLLFGTTSALQIGKFSTGIAEHTSRLHSLYLGNGSSFAGMVTRDRRLNITNGLVVGNGSVGSIMATIAGGLGNKILTASEGAGIAGGERNTVKGENSVIGGGKVNNVSGHNAVVVGGEYNEGNAEGAVVIGGKGNISSNKGGVVLGGSGNTAEGESSLVLGEGAVGARGSFAWNGNAGQESARIDASNGVLIGTYDTIDGVNLVVKGAMKIGGDAGSTAYAGEIRMVDGCFYAYDGEYWHIVNQSATGCNAIEAAQTCRFGSVYLQAGDTVTAYKEAIGTCERREATCNPNNGKVEYNGVEYKYPYCYNTLSLN